MIANAAASVRQSPRNSSTDPTYLPGSAANPARARPCSHQRDRPPQVEGNALIVARHAVERRVAGKPQLVAGDPFDQSLRRIVLVTTCVPEA